MARTVKHQTALLLDRFGWHEPHTWPRDSFTNRLRIGGVVLLPFDVGLQVSRRYQSHEVPEARATDGARRKLVCQPASETKPGQTAASVDDG